MVDTATSGHYWLVAMSVVASALSSNLGLNTHLRTVVTTEQTNHENTDKTEEGHHWTYTIINQAVTQLGGEWGVFILCI